MCISFKFDGAQNFSSMRMCIEFLIRVLKQKNAHVFCFGKVNSLSSAPNKLAEFCDNSVSSPLHTNNMLRGTH